MNGMLDMAERLAELQQRFATKPTTRWIGLQLTREEAQLVERALSALALPAQAAADAAGVHVINPERTPEGITPGMVEAAERIARSVAGGTHGLQRSTTTRQVGPLTLNAVPCLKDPESGEVFFTPDVTAVLVSLAGALEVQG